MLQNLINRFESYQAIQVNKNFNSHELTVLGKILLEGAREVEVANVIRFPSIEQGFSIFSIESGSTLSPQAVPVAAGEVDAAPAPAPAIQPDRVLPRLASGLVSDLKNDAYHLIVRQGNGLEHGMVLASFTNMQSAGIALRKLAKLNARKTRFWKILGALIVLYLLLTIPMIKRPPQKSLEEITTSMEMRNPEVARQMENINRSRTVGSELMAQPPQTMPAQPDPSSMLGGPGTAMEPAQTAQASPAQGAAARPEQSQGNFGF
ncbi:hypothetical protein UNDYM_5048 [Undibacterium sp. YM2]|uniref:hypothetical protein n=1 Tax=Undibacterium sp. YM2 TaxID=2058625 RepID=UPI001331E0A2|nr:hypothetical protein [Undibacterium sp. YM2]BBB69301.1 hypothetical protein UNDYM_5048 [Undibacterium sp. YM2]